MKIGSYIGSQGQGPRPIGPGALPHTDLKSKTKYTSLKKLVQQQKLPIVKTKKKKKKKKGLVNKFYPKQQLDPLKMILKNNFFSYPTSHTSKTKKKKNPSMAKQQQSRRPKSMHTTQQQSHPLTLWFHPQFEIVCLLRVVDDGVEKTMLKKLNDYSSKKKIKTRRRRRS